MNECLDAARGEPLLTRGPGGVIAAADDEQMIHVSGVAFLRYIDWRVRERGAVRRPERPAPSGDGGQVRQFCPEDRRLDFVQA